ncbi:MAG: glycosyltransferase family 2 protein [Candidatus Shapirobacteria bacterium]
MKQKDPLVSILTPAYNVENKVERYLKSILSQTYSNIELIFVNDGSIDNTEKIFLLYKNKFEKRGINVKYIYQENKGLSGAINTGLKMVTGKFLTWPDADDFLSNDSIEKKVNFLIKNKSIAVVSSDAYIYNESDLIKPIALIASYYPKIIEKNQFLLLLEEKSIFCPGCHLIRTKALKKVNPSLTIYESRLGQNWQLLLPLYYRYDHGFINQPLFNYVVYKNSISHPDENISFLEKINRINNYKKILVNTLKSIKMKENEYKKYRKIVNNNFFKKKKALFLSFLKEC